MDKSPGTVVALAGNPNVGKSTLFNCLTGLHQHTGNWPGKTVRLAQGEILTEKGKLTVIDLPGTYSLRSRSREEQVTEEFLRAGEADCVIAVCDASCLERNLILVQQILRLAPKTVVCLNLMDEARRAGMEIDCGLLQALLGVPVVPAAAAAEEGVEELVHRVLDVISGKEPCTPVLLREDASGDAYAKRAEAIAAQVLQRKESGYRNVQQRLDRLLTSRRFGFPLAALFLLTAVWLTVVGANYPSRLLQRGFDLGEIFLHGLLGTSWISSLLVEGVYATTARVVSVMLPPMMIFFPLFTLLEDMGYLPRVAFLLDRPMARCGTCGKQALTMCMGLGCNAVGVTGCRIMDSPRERALAMVTNSFMPCNGRFPTLILLGTVFLGAGGSAGALTVTALILLGAVFSMGVTKALSALWRRGEKSVFLLELPPFRRPRIGQVLVRSLLDRAVFIAGRAVAVAAPAGAVLWLCGHIELAGEPLLIRFASLLEPLGRALGLDGAILLAFLFAIPANELMLPVLVMMLTGAAVLGPETAAKSLGSLLLSAGWNWEKAVCTMAFTVFHWPCSTTLITVYKESGKLRYAALAFLLPTVAGIFLCSFLHGIFQLCG